MAATIALSGDFALLVFTQGGVPMRTSELTANPLEACSLTDAEAMTGSGDLGVDWPRGQVPVRWAQHLASPRLIPTRKAPGLFAGCWRLIQALGATPRVLVWDGRAPSASAGEG